MDYAAHLQPSTATCEPCRFELARTHGPIVAAFKQLVLNHSPHLPDLMRLAGNHVALADHINSIADIRHPAIAAVRPAIAILLDTHFFSAKPVAVASSQFLFLYDRLGSLEKLTAIQHLLEARNLVLMGGLPSPRLLPISLAVFGAYLTAARARWPEIEAAGRASQGALYDADVAFGHLYAAKPPVDSV